MDKRTQLVNLTERRKAAHWDRYNGIGDYHNGAYECDFVSPYTKAAGNVDAQVMVMLQDWSSDNRMRGAFKEYRATLGHNPKSATNRNLKKLLEATFGFALSDIYGTNLFPFIKPGKASSKIPSKDMLRAAREFGLPQVRIVNPKLVICLGLETFNALRQACELSPSPDMGSAIDDPFGEGDTRVWCSAHTGYWGMKNRKKDGGDVFEDWQKMKADILPNAYPAEANGGSRRLDPPYGFRPHTQLNRHP